MGWLLVVVPGVIWGASFLFIAEGLQAVAPMGVTFVRIAVGFVTLSLVPSARRPIVRADRLKTALLGILWLAFPLSMFPLAEQHVSSALAGLLNGATPCLPRSSRASWHGARHPVESRPAWRSGSQGLRSSRFQAFRAPTRRQIAPTVKHPAY